MPGQHSRHQLRTALLLLAAGVGLLACVVIAGVLALLALYLLTVL